MAGKKEVRAAVAQISDILGSFTAREQAHILRQLKPVEGIPLSVFSAPLSGLELVVRYLKDNEQRTVKEIASLLNRRPTTIYTTYAKSTKKYPQALDVSDRSIVIPSHIIASRKLAVLESIVVYLKEHLSLSEIARLLHRSPSTVNTVYRRAQRKVST